MALIPSAFLYIAIGLLCGTVFNDKQVGGAFEKIAYLPPFAHACDAGKAAIAGDYAAIWPHLIWVIVYAVVLMALAVVIFRRKMSGDNTNPQ